DHDIPSRRLCMMCHGSLPEHVLGVGAIQMSHDKPGLNIKTLGDAGLLTVPHPESFAIPGDAVAKAALGYLHANCSHCHNPNGVRMRIPYSLRLYVGDTTVEGTNAWKTTVNVPVAGYVNDTVVVRLLPGQPELSCIYFR